MEQKHYRLCYISHNYRDLHGSGNKAKHDNEISLYEIGAVNLGLRTTYHSGKVASFFLDLAGVLKAVCRLRRGDMVVLQYPLKKYFSFVCRAAHLRGARVVALIHDLGSMRRRRLSIAQEVQRLSGADYVIATNERMADWLKAQGLQRPMGALSLHDYRSSAPMPGTSSCTDTPQKVVYAGALAPRKNAFLLQMPEEVRNFQLHIYGHTRHLPGLAATDTVGLHEFMDSDTFIARHPGHMGLVWDGGRTDCCEGHFGEYLKWNTPHKASFYLRAGMPIVVWKQAAIAPIVEAERIGISINSIAELNTLLHTLDAAQWQELCSHAAQVGRRMNEGYYFKKALQSAIDTLCKA